MNAKTAFRRLTCRVRGHEWLAVFAFDSGIAMTVGVDWVRYVAATCTGIVRLDLTCACCGKTEPCPIVTADADPMLDGAWLRHADGTRTLVAEAGNA